jgi:transcriptional regulator with XRE-family HTH domain
MKFMGQTAFFHDLLQNDRKKRNIPVRTLAKFARVNEEKYREWEKGISLPTLEQLAKMCGNNSSLMEALRVAYKAQEVSQLPNVKLEIEQAADASTLIVAVESTTSTDEQEPIVSVEPSSSPSFHTPSPLLSFGDALRKCREARGQTQGDIAAKIGMSNKMVSHWEHGRMTPSRLQCDLLCEIFPDLAAMHAPVVFTHAPTSKADFGFAFRTAREKSGLAIDDVAQKLNVAASTVYAWAKGSTFPNELVYDKLMELFPILNSLPRPDNLIAPPPNALSRAADVESKASTEPSASSAAESDPTDFVKTISTPDLLTTLDVALAAFGAVGMSLTPKFEREMNGQWLVKVSNQHLDDSPSLEFRASGATMFDATKTALLGLEPALTAEEIAIQEQIAELQAKLGLIQTANVMVKKLG